MHVGRQNLGLRAGRLSGAAGAKCKSALLVLVILLGTGLPAVPAHATNSSFGRADTDWLNYYNNPTDQATWAPFCQAGGGGLYDGTAGIEAIGVPVCTYTSTYYIDVPTSLGKQSASSPVTTSWPGFQCTELAWRYLFVKYHWLPLSANGAGIVQAYAEAHGLQPVPGTGDNLPQMGDVISFSSTPDFSDIGHVALVSAVTPGTVPTISFVGENQKYLSSTDHTDFTASVNTITVTNGKWSYYNSAKDPYIEWLPLPQTPTWADVSPTGKAQDNDNFNAVSCVSATDCFAVGYFMDGKGESHPLIEQYAGSAGWSLVSSHHQPTTESELDGVSCPISTFCVAVGTTTTVRGNSAPLLEMMTKGTWSATVLPKSNSPATAGYDVRSRFNAVSCASATYCVAVGRDRLGQPDHLFTLTWDGSRWSPTGSGAHQVQFLDGISCAAQGVCVAVGFQPEGTNFEALIETLGLTPGHPGWYRVPLTGLPTPFAGLSQYLAAVSCPSTSSCTMVDLYPQGNVSENASQTLIGTFNGTTPSVVAEPDYAYPGTTDTAPLGFTGVSCSGPMTCAFTGSYSPGFEGQSAVSTETPAGWQTTPVDDVAGYSGGVSGVSCTTTGFCLAVGDRANTAVPLALSVTL